ncbi:carboxymuconolactone decarboxylase family protein [Gemella bergeri]|nr:carboxymuconolactone decarboxylase family protein [Gemella bergeri]
MNNNYREQMLSNLETTDKEFVELFSNFAFNEVIHEANIDLDEKSRFLSIIAICLGCGAKDLYKNTLSIALNILQPEEIKEILYQATAYLGLAKTLRFFNITNKFFEENSVKISIKIRTISTKYTRRKLGEEAQIGIFGEQMKNFANKGSDDVKHINHWLVDNCFGDYYTRKGLNYKERELITFCFLYAQGNCENQLKAHIQANLRLGNTREFLVSVISNGIPYIGYPRSLNALNILNEVTNFKKEN